MFIIKTPFHFESVLSGKPDTIPYWITQRAYNISCYLITFIFKRLKCVQWLFWKPFNILKFNSAFAGGDEVNQEKRKDFSSLFFNLELRRMQLEKDIGLYLFLKTYRKMMSILNGDFSIAGKIVNGSETYTVPKSGNNIYIF